MPRQEGKTDIFVNDLLRKSGISLSSQDADINIDLRDALQTASKNGTGNVGYPDYCGIVNGYVFVIEDKASVYDHAKYLDDKETELDMSQQAIKKYALNGAVHYAIKIMASAPYEQLFGFGVSGNEDGYRITPFFLRSRETKPMILEPVNDFNSFSHSNIGTYYCMNVLKEEIDVDKTEEEIQRDAAELHEFLRSYGSLTTEQKPIIVSGILIALSEIDYKNFDINTLICDKTSSDGEKIFVAIKKALKRISVENSLILRQFSLIASNVQINTINSKLGKTPLRFFTEFLYNRIFKNIKYVASPADFVGRFYNEFISYSGGDGQTLGIILTPTHITQLFCDLVHLTDKDKVFDPCCGTGGFLIAALHNMIEQSGKTDEEVQRIRDSQLHGIEMQDYMYTVCFTNLLLRSCNTQNVICDNFFNVNVNNLSGNGFTVGMINPPYSQGSSKDHLLYETNFVFRMLGCLAPRARGIAIVPQSAMFGNSKAELEIKREILERHTLEGVITLNTQTFFGVGVNPCICVFTAGVPHNKDKLVKFIDFSDDGYVVEPKRGLIKTESADAKKAHLLQVWNDEIVDNSICIRCRINSSDDWLYNAKKNEELNLTNKLFTPYKEKSELIKMISELDTLILSKPKMSRETINEKVTANFTLRQIFPNIIRGTAIPKRIRKPGTLPYISASLLNHGEADFVSVDEKYIYKDCLTVPFIGGENCTFYHDGEFVPSSDVAVLQNENFDKHIYVFLIGILNVIMQKYSFGYKASLERLQKQTIPLPITSDGKPDFEFMSDYIKTQFQIVFEEELKRLKSKLDEWY